MYMADTRLNNSNKLGKKYEPVVIHRHWTLYIIWSIVSFQNRHQFGISFQREGLARQIKVYFQLGLMLSISDMQFISACKCEAMFVTVSKYKSIDLLKKIACC